MNGSAIKVSVVTMTYQHAAFIEACVAGVREQRFNAPMEHLIGEDGSTDGTRAICERLAAEQPGRIRLFLRDRKDVLRIRGRATGRRNLIGLLNEARGEYIALCEGDDLWCDPDKLAMQVDVLDRDPELSACFTNAINRSDGKEWAFFKDGPPTTGADGLIRLEHLVRENFIPTATLVFRRSMLLPLPDQVLRSPVADWVLSVHAAKQGPLAYVDRITAVRNIHPGGLISMMDDAYKLEVNVAALEQIGTMVDDQGRAHVRGRQVELLRASIGRFLAHGRTDHAKHALALVKEFGSAGFSLRERLRWWALLHWPGAVRSYHRLRTGKS
ncbi:MAG: glycosyltransferase [Flavobacteriales bacterium]|nr:glycosyltransferase [Flavobacteriales bacterium]